MTEEAFKFTRASARSPFTGLPWPDGEWVEVEGELEICRNGVHACRAEALPRWIDDELWRIELEDVEDEVEGVLVARRGRLLDRIEEWNAQTSRELARSCAARAEEIARQHPDELLEQMARDVAAIAEGPDPSATALSMYCTAHAADVAEPRGYAAERQRQADWLLRRLGLEPA